MLSDIDIALSPAKTILKENILSFFCVVIKFLWPPAKRHDYMWLFTFHYWQDHIYVDGTKTRILDCLEIMWNSIF